MSDYTISYLSVMGVICFAYTLRNIYRVEVALLKEYDGLNDEL